MKLGKLSLVAVMALGTSAFAIENVKVSGDVKVIYQTSDTEVRPGASAVGGDQGTAGTGALPQTGMFENGNGVPLGVSPYNGASAGGISGRIGVTADLLKSVSAGAEVQVYTNLGLGSNVFNDNMINAPHKQTGFTNGVNPAGTSTFNSRQEDAANMSQLWLATTMGKTTVKAGRMELDTPLVFTEKWNVAHNTFGGIVAINTDLPDTTLVGAWVGQHNGHGAYFEGYVANQNEGGFLLAGSPGRTVDMNSFHGFGAGDVQKGAYAAGAVNKSIPSTTVQAWYYNVVSAADAYWLQADTKIAGMVTLGAQYANMDPKFTSTGTNGLSGLNDSSIYALKAGVDVMGVNLYAAYSSADKDGVLGFSNISTADKTKIYTGDNSIYFDGVVTAPGVDAYKIGASGALMGVKLAAAYINCNDKYDDTVDGFDFSASTSIGNLGLTAIYTIVNNGADTVAAEGVSGQTAGMIYMPANPGSPFYRGRDIDTLRLIAQLKF
jgi:imipenem/basic amino acid-specific outer membrane pore